MTSELFDGDRRVDVAEPGDKIPDRGLPREQPVLYEAGNRQSGESLGATCYAELCIWADGDGVGPIGKTPANERCFSSCGAGGPRCR